jgi:hypothetical protein
MSGSGFDRARGAAVLLAADPLADPRYLLQEGSRGGARDLALFHRAESALRARDAYSSIRGRRAIIFRVLDTEAVDPPESGEMEWCGTCGQRPTLASADECEECAARAEELPRQSLEALPGLRSPDGDGAGRRDLLRQLRPRGAAMRTPCPFCGDERATLIPYSGSPRLTRWIGRCPASSAHVWARFAPDDRAEEVERGFVPDLGGKLREAAS